MARVYHISLSNVQEFSETIKKEEFSDSKKQNRNNTRAGVFGNHKKGQELSFPTL